MITHQSASSRITPHHTKRATRSALCAWLQLDNSNHAPERVAQSCRESLEELQLTYIDLFLMHWPVTDHKGPTLEPPIKVQMHYMVHACLSGVQQESYVHGC